MQRLLGQLHAGLMGQRQVKDEMDASANEYAGHGSLHEQLAHATRSNQCPSGLPSHLKPKSRAHAAGPPVHDGTDFVLHAHTVPMLPGVARR